MTNLSDGIDRCADAWCRTVGAFALAIFVMGAPTTRAAETTWSGQIRVRTEGFDRSFSGNPAQWIFLQRTRIGLQVQASPEVRIFVQAQDSRAWGDEFTTLNSIQNLDLHQAYADYDRRLRSADLRVRAGRQEVSYGDERLIGAVGWDNVGRAFDALHIRMGHGRLTADIMASRNTDYSEPLSGVAGAVYTVKDDVFLTYNRITNAAADRGVEPYVMYRSTPSYLVSIFETTLGERFFGTFARLRIEQEFACQLGRRRDQDIRAYLFTGQAYVGLAPRWTLGAGCDIVSGDDPGDSDFQLFDLKRIFQTGHKFYGIMDVAPGIAGSAGLLDPYAVLKAPGLWAGSVKIAGHGFSVMESSVPQTGPEGSSQASYLGFELDAEMSVPVSSGTRLELGAAFFAPGDRLTDVGLDTTSYWGYLQGIVGF